MENLDTVTAIITLVFSGFTAAGALVAALQLPQMKKQSIASTEQTQAATLQLEQMKKETVLSVDRYRRKNTVEIMIEWCNAISKETSFAEAIVEDFDEKQCESLYRRIKFSVDKDIKEKLCVILCPNYGSGDDCKKCKADDNDDEANVDGLLLLELRWHIIRYLNALETVMIAWQHQIVHEDTILDNFHIFMTRKTKEIYWKTLEK